MKERLNKLLTVKSIATLILTAVFAYLAIRGTISGEQFQIVYTTVIGFYFGTQYEKRAKEVTENV
jgi:Flp pilus assembly protein TadB